MIDSTRALLDQLMGKDRNEEPEKRRQRRWDDKDVCPYFLCGFCCHDLFTNTKSDIGFCDKDHDEACQEMFKKEPLATQCRYERKFLRMLHDQIRSVDARVRRGKDRQETKTEKPDGNTPVGPYAAEINLKNEKIKKLQKEAESLGEEGKMDQLNEVMAKIEGAKKEKEALEAKNKASTNTYGLDGSGSPMTICEICGVWKSDNPEDARAKNHFQGKQHQGFELIRKKIEELEQKEGVGKGDIPREERSRSRERSRDRDRDRRDRSSKDRSSRDRSSRRSKGRSSRRRSKSRSRDRRRRRRESSSSDSD